MNVGVLKDNFMLTNISSLKLYMYCLNWSHWKTVSGVNAYVTSHHINVLHNSYKLVGWYASFCIQPLVQPVQSLIMAMHSMTCWIFLVVNIVVLECTIHHILLIFVTYIWLLRCQIYLNLHITWSIFVCNVYLAFVDSLHVR